MFRIRIRPGRHSSAQIDEVLREAALTDQDTRNTVLPGIRDTMRSLRRRRRRRELCPSAPVMRVRFDGGHIQLPADEACRRSCRQAIALLQVGRSIDVGAPPIQESIPAAIRGCCLRLTLRPGSASRGA
jgi:hypothetical protein